MAQVARNLTDAVDGFLARHRFLICDRNSWFTDQFRRALKNSGLVIALTPYRDPNCNAFAERFVRSIKEECLNRMMLFGEGSLHRAIRELVEHEPGERPQRCLRSRISAPHARPSAERETTDIRVHERSSRILGLPGRAAKRRERQGRAAHPSARPARHDSGQ